MSGARRLGRVCAVAVLALLAASCDSRPERPRVVVATDASRQALNASYSLLYEQARSLATLRWVTRSRLQPRATREAIGVATDYYEELARQLERLSVAHPALQLDVPLASQGGPRVAWCEAWQGDALRPASGAQAHERGLLLAFLGALEEQQRLTAQIAEGENVVELRGFVQVQRQALDALYRRFDARLQTGVAGTSPPGGQTGGGRVAVVVRRAG